MKKGFTLIELLCVIVILAIISIITIPLMLNVLEDTQARNYENSANGFVEAIDDQLMADQFDAALIKDGIYEIDDPKVAPKNIKGEAPEEGWVQIVDGEVVKGEFLFHDDVVVEFDGKKSKVNTKKNDITRPVDNNQPQNEEESEEDSE